MYFDYVSADRPALGKPPLPDAELQGILRAHGVLGSSLKGQTGWPALPGAQAGTVQLCNLRAMSPSLVVSADQVRDLVPADNRGKSTSPLALCTRLSFLDHVHFELWLPIAIKNVIFGVA